MNENEPQPIECRAAVEIPATASNEILFLPIGLHAITPVSGGIGRPINVKVSAESAASMEKQRQALVNKGKRPYFDFNHEDGPASFWPDSFIWRPTEGVVACGEWSRRGKAAVEGKDFRAFSPVFHVDNKRAGAALVICKETAEPNMGGLVNNPAFKDLPLWAKNAGATGDAVNAETKKETMNEEEIAALRAKQSELEAEVKALKASNDANADTKETELRALNAELKVEELRKENERNATIITARNKTEAENAVKAAIQRGAILSQDKKNQGELIARATVDPSFLTVIHGMQGNAGQMARRITGNTIEIVSEAPTAIFAGMAKLLSASKKIVGFSARHNEDRLANAREISAIYSAEFGGKNRSRLMDFPIVALQDAIVAGDVTDTDWGTLAGTLVVQRTLELLKFMFPVLTKITTDFSAEPVTFGQTVMTRTVGIPSVVSYNTSTGWSDSTPDTNDVPVVLDQHRGVQIGINENVLASTVRRLFDELAPAQAYALGKDLVDNLYTRITDANFTNNTVSTLANFNRSKVIDIATALNLQGVPTIDRFLLAYSTYFGGIQKDSAVISLAAFQRPQMIEGPQQNGPALAINVANFDIYDAPNLPTNNGNVVGFAGSKSALCMVTRLPNDYASVFPGATGGGVVQIVTNPDIGMSVMLVQYVDHKLGKAAQRIALMYGTAAGQGAAGNLIKAASGTGSAQS